VTNGHLDEVPVNRIKEWERQFHQFMGARFAEVGQKLRQEKVLSKELEAELKKGIDAFKSTFK
jgi:F-type H+/Na+-transporting ATPase subunit alpha